MEGSSGESRAKIAVSIEETKRPRKGAKDGQGAYKTPMSGGLG